MKSLLRLRLNCLLLGMLIALTSAMAQVSTDLAVKLQRTLDSMQKKGSMKGLSASIQLKDGKLWSGAAGISSVTPPVNVKPDDLFLIGSVTKTLTAACILHMCDARLMNLDDSIGKFLDSMPNISPKITVRQLLRHQSGIYDVLQHPTLNFYLLSNSSTVVKPEDLIRKFNDTPTFAPGSNWSYCNTNYFILGMIIEKVTGNAFYKEIRKRFFTPLGLTSFAFPSYEPMAINIAHVWIDLNNDGITDDAHNFYQNYRALNAMAGASGGYYSTASDLSKWMRAYMRGDLLSKAMMDEAKTLVFASGTPGQKYGLGMMRALFNGIEAFGHGGDLSYSAQSWYFPMKDVSISVLNNDSKYTSWALLPIVEALHKTYCDWQMSVGLSDTHLQTDITMHVYPNPFYQNLTVEWAGNRSTELELKIFDIEGKTVKHTKIKTKDSLHFADVASYPKGVYRIAIFENGVLIGSESIVKQ